MTMDQSTIEKIPHIGEIRHRGPFAGVPEKRTATFQDRSWRQNKVVESLEEAIRRTGLQSGMTISFHHHFRNGDHVVNQVLDTLARMGFKNLTLAASSLSAVHAPLIDHIKNGVVTHIETSGLRGELAEEVSRGLMDCPVVFRSQGDRKPVFVGGVSVSGWTPWQNGIWRTQLPETLHFEQLYVNGSRAVRARTPNTGWYYVKGSKETVFDKKNTGLPVYAVQRIAVDSNELKPFAGLSREELRRATALFYHKWDVTRKPIDHAMPDSGYFFISVSGMKPWNAITGGSRYVLDNYLGALDAPGEWYLSPDGWLYYMPREGEDMRTVSCTAPTLSRLIVFAGTADQPVAGKEFRNIAFRTSSYTMPIKGNEPMQAAAAMAW